MIELTIALDGASLVPLYEQIYRFIKNEITGRQILPGERLPSTRLLAKQLSVSRSTTDLAYAQLAAEGYIEARDRRGYYVCEIDGLLMIDEAKREVIESIQETEPVWAYDFAVGGVDKEAFPIQKWMKISKAVLLDTPDLFNPGDHQGEEGLRNELAIYLRHARGVCCTPGQIVVGAGNDYLLMLLSVLLGKDRCVAMENPTYVSARQVFQLLGYSLREIAMDEDGMKVDDLGKSDADIAYLMPSHQFPIGSVMPLKRRLALLGWANQNDDRYIVEDDYDSEFRYRGKPIPSLQGYDTNGHVIYLGTFSKSISPAIRISYMVLPEKLSRIYRDKGRSFACTVSRMDQRIIEIFMKESHYERHLNRMRSIYRAKHDLLLENLREMKDICTVQGENAGLHVLIRFRNGLTEQRAIALAASENVRVYGISEFAVANQTIQESNAVILGYGGLTQSQILEACKRLKKAWRE